MRSAILNRLVVKVGGRTLLGAYVINVHLCRLKRSVCVVKNSRFCRRQWKVGFNFDLLTISLGLF